MRYKFAYIVTRTDTHGGFSVRANSPEHAVGLAMRHASMRGATEVKVAPITPAGGERKVIRVGG